MAMLNNQLVTLHCCWFHILNQTPFEGLCEHGVHSKIPFIIIFAITKQIIYISRQTLDIEFHPMNIP